MAGPLGRSPRAVRRNGTACPGGCRRLTAIPPNIINRGTVGSAARRPSSGTLGESRGAGDEARGARRGRGSSAGAAGCEVRARRRSAPVALALVVSTTFFAAVLTDRTCPLHTVNRLRRPRPAGFSSGAPASLISSRNSLESLPCGLSSDSDGHSSASFASRQKTTGGEGKLAGHRDCHRHPEILSKGHENP
ncbi:hypothetical protein SAMN04489742_2109 [Arthrobacter crystallopoietes]|uniref:Uncharacterized protein n=1 Tax=Crystallibacter crystallopoietes TaxID=37928 RepID=A0A1H1CVA6_9MICC|nr:hypothetical protein SAMN04489742_2109 [Arthrobacter crystallopoietes]